MKVKIKGTDKIKTINPNEWALIEKNGNASEYDIVERNTVWAAPIDKKGGIVETNIREFELDHWQRLVELGSRNNWKRVEHEGNEPIKSSVKNAENEISETTSDIIELSQLQVELTQAQIDESKAQKKFIELQTSDLKRKYIYFIVGIILGNLGTVLLWIQWLSREEVSSNIP